MSAGFVFAVERRRRKIGRQKGARRVDGLLHFLLGDIDIQTEIELQRDDGAAVGTGGGHLLEAGHLAELALERSGDRGRHHVGAGARIKRDHLDGGIVHFGQRRNRQLACKPRCPRAGSRPSAAWWPPAA